MKKWMMMLGLTMTLGLAGCSEPTLDGSSEEALETSLEVMMEEATPEQEKKVDLAAKILTLKALHELSKEKGGDEEMNFMAVMLYTQMPGTQEEATSRILAELDGKTFDYLLGVPDDEANAQYEKWASVM